VLLFGWALRSAALHEQQIDAIVRFLRSLDHHVGLRSKWRREHAQWNEARE
jgi:hypothetical protein